MLRKYACLAIHQPRFTKNMPRKKFNIETNFSDPLSRQWLIEIDSNFKRAAFERCYAHFVFEHQIGVGNGVEPFKVAARIGEPQLAADGFVHFIDHLFSFFGYGRPLPGRHFKPHIAIGDNALTMLNNGNACLMAFGINIGKNGYIQTGHFEVALVVES